MITGSSHKQFGDSGNRLLTTINAVLEATRLEKHHIDPLMQPVRLDVLVEEVVATLQPLLAKR